MSDETNITELEPVKLNDSWWLIRDSKGNGSISTTLLVVSFVLTTLGYVLSMFNFEWLRPFDVAACGVYFTPICALYFGRRWTENKQSQ